MVISNGSKQLICTNPEKVLAPSIVMETLLSLEGKQLFGSIKSMIAIYIKCLKNLSEIYSKRD